MRSTIGLIAAVLLGLFIPAKAAMAMDCLTPARIAKYKAAPAKNLEEVFAACRPELASRLERSSLSDMQLKAVFAGVAAYAMLPYKRSRAVRLDDLLKEPGLDCDNYATLTGHFLNILLPGAHDFAMVGFDGGAVGNHAQVFVTVERRQMLLDPTFGIVADASFDDVLQGRPVASDHIYDFTIRDDPPTYNQRKLVLRALGEGAYKPSDLLYFYNSVEEYIDVADQYDQIVKGPHQTYDATRLFHSPAALRIKKKSDLEKGL